MANSADQVIASVRVKRRDLRKLQLMAQVYERSVGELIRDAIGKHIEELSATPEFLGKAEELQKRNSETLSELLDASRPSGSRSQVRPFTGKGKAASR